ncbi:cytochrome b [Paracoccus laeviglucosivorans]|uniref:Cytochrome b561 n=1 Tax=Paracoccus laeviglucosivorans TaxID=1197861 RepID=A0A521EW56_9RHOB|nr:cytochrome b/b6 domain-containing protein [Paracoccus laeviglucosivorans]SMO87330.1 cytochrome b561 [Paracoccus laeviglucosivorans]
MTDPAGYRTPARLLHWIIAAAVLLMIPAGLIMTREGLPKGLGDGLFLFHKNMGTLLIPLIALRILYRWLHPAPPLPPSVPEWQRRAAGVSHLALYVLLVVMPLSGFVRVRAGGFPIELLDSLGAGPWLAKSEPLARTAEGLHYAAAMLLIAVLVVHVAAALQHALIRRDGVWQRMWPPAGR